MIDLKYLILLFVIYTLFNVFTIYYTIRIKDKILPYPIFGIFIYYLILLSYIINISEKVGPFRNIDIIFQIVLFGIIEIGFLFFWLKMKYEELNRLWV